MELINADAFRYSTEMKNLELLYRYMLYPPELDAAQWRAMAQLFADQHWSFGEAVQRLNTHLGLGAADAWWLIGAGWLVANLSEPLTVDTIVVWKKPL